MLAPCLNSCVTLNKKLNLSEPQSPSLCNGGLLEHETSMRSFSIALRPPRSGSSLLSLRTELSAGCRSK